MSPTAVLPPSTRQVHDAVSTIEARTDLTPQQQLDTIKGQADAARAEAGAASTQADALTKKLAAMDGQTPAADRADTQAAAAAATLQTRNADAFAQVLELAANRVAKDNGLAAPYPPAGRDRFRNDPLVTKLESQINAATPNGVAISDLPSFKARSLRTNGAAEKQFLINNAGSLDAKNLTEADRDTIRNYFAANPDKRPTTFTPTSAIAADMGATPDAGDAGLVKALNEGYRLIGGKFQQVDPKTQPPLDSGFLARNAGTIRADRINVAEQNIIGNTLNTEALLPDKFALGSAAAFGVGAGVVKGGVGELNALNLGYRLIDGQYQRVTDPSTQPPLDKAFLTTYAGSIRSDRLNKDELTTIGNAYSDPKTIPEPFSTTSALSYDLGFGADPTTDLAKAKAKAVGFEFRDGAYRRIPAPPVVVPPPPPVVPKPVGPSVPGVISDRTPPIKYTVFPSDNGKITIQYDDGTGLKTQSFDNLAALNGPELKYRDYGNPNATSPHPWSPEYLKQMDSLTIVTTTVARSFTTIQAKIAAGAAPKT